MTYNFFRTSLQIEQATDQIRTSVVGCRLGRGGSIVLFCGSSISLFFVRLGMTPTNAYWLSQFLVGIAGTLYFVSFQLPDRRQVMWLLVSAALCIAAHFFLLDRTTAGLLASIAGLRALVASFSRSRRWMVFFITSSLAAFLVTYSSALSLLLLVGSVTATWALFQKSDPVMRLAYMCSTSLWLVHNIMVATPGGIALEGMFLLSNALGYYRFYVRGPRPRVRAAVDSKHVPVSESFPLATTSAS